MASHLEADSENDHEKSGGSGQGNPPSAFIFGQGQGGSCFQRHQHGCLAIRVRLVDATGLQESGFGGPSLGRQRLLFTSNTGKRLMKSPGILEAFSWLFRQGFGDHLNQISRQG